MTPEEFVKDSLAYVLWLDDQVERGSWTEHERCVILRAIMVDALDYILTLSSKSATLIDEELERS